MCSKTTVAPLDRIKILLQAHQSNYRHLGVFSGLLQIVKKESFIALYKGNGAQMVRIFPYAATQFTAFEIYKKVRIKSNDVVSLLNNIAFTVFWKIVWPNALHSTF